MEAINLKVIPLIILSLILAYFTFSTAGNLINQIEIIFSIDLVLAFLLTLIILLSITTILVSLCLALVKNSYYRIGFFVLLFLPYASVFMLANYIDPIYMLIFLILFVAMSATIIIEFDRLYANQIKAHLGVPARANVKTLAFFIALTAALAFFSINSKSKNQEELADRIINDITVATSTAIQEYGLVEKMMGQTPLGQTGAIPLNRIQPQIDQYISEQINAVVTPYRAYIIYILTLLLFGTIAGAATLSGMLTSLLSMIFLPILKSSGYIKESVQTVEVTRLTL